MFTVNEYEIFWTTDISTYRQLFVDNLVIARMGNCSKRLHPFRKEYDFPVLKPEHGWERNGCQGNVVYNPTQGIFQCWYTPIPSDKTEDFSCLNDTCYAESKDGVVWEKPLYDRFLWKGKRTNIVLSAQTLTGGKGGLIHVLNNVILEDGEKQGPRYRSVVFRCGTCDDYTGPLYGYYTAESADGIAWKVNPDVAISKWRDDPELSDTCSLMFDSHTNRYVLFTKKQKVCPDGVGDQGYVKRVRGISFSDDFIHWTKPQVMVLPDDRDDPDLNLYNASGFVYEGQYLGFLDTYHSGLEGPLARRIDVQFISSRDGETWWRSGNRQTIVTVGADASWDRGSVSIWGNKPILGPDGQLWLYYMGCSLHHLPPALGLFPTDESFRGIGLAKLRRDGFVSMDAGETEGFILTRRVKFKGSRLFVNAETQEGGYVAAEIYHTLHRSPHPSEEALGARLDGVVEGFSKDDCIPVSGNHTNGQICWKSNPSLTPLEDSLVAIKFYLKDASLYSFWIQ